MRFPFAVERAYPYLVQTRKAWAAALDPPRMPQGGGSSRGTCGKSFCQKRDKAHKALQNRTKTLSVAYHGGRNMAPTQREL